MCGRGAGTRRRGGTPCVAVIAVMVFGWAGAGRAVYGAGADRDLSGFAGAGQAFTVSIALDVPPDTQVAGLEDAPPPGWSVSNISDGGTWDSEAEKVKWGPFFEGSIPALVTYDATPPGELAGTLCFSGRVTFDLEHQTIGGDTCLAFDVPTSSQWGCLVLALAVVCAGTLALPRRASAPGVRVEPVIASPVLRTGGQGSRVSSAAGGGSAYPCHPRPST